jgi:hypothetical protein
LIVPLKEVAPMRREKLKLGILGAAWAGRLRTYDCPRLVRLRHTARRHCQPTSLLYLTITKELTVRLSTLFSDVARRRVPLLDRFDYLAMTIATVMRSMDDVPWTEFCDWALRVGYTEAFCRQRFWKMAKVAGFISEHYQSYIRLVDRFIRRVEHIYGPDVRDIVREKIDGWPHADISEYHGIELDDLEDILAEIAKLYRECQCADVDKE